MALNLIEKPQHPAKLPNISAGRNSFWSCCKWSWSGSAPPGPC